LRNRAELERFPAKWMPVRVKKTRQNKEIEPPFRFNRNGKGSRISAARDDRGAARLPVFVARLTAAKPTKQ
jgi:hypothetical protein